MQHQLSFKISALGDSLKRVKYHIGCSRSPVRDCHSGLKEKCLLIWWIKIDETHRIRRIVLCCCVRMGFDFIDISAIINAAYHWFFTDSPNWFLIHFLRRRTDMFFIWDWMSKIWCPFNVSLSLVERYFIKIVSFLPSIEMVILQIEQLAPSAVFVKWNICYFFFSVTTLGCKFSEEF